MPREEANNDEVHLTVKKIFIGGIRDALDEDILRKYFEKFGHINDCFLMYDKDGKARGFAFLEFDGKLSNLFLHQFLLEVSFRKKSFSIKTIKEFCIIAANNVLICLSQYCSIYRRLRT